MTLLFADRPDDIPRVRDVLLSAGFTFRGVTDVVGPHGFGFLGRDEIAPLLRRTRGGTALDTLIRLFLAGVAVERAAAQAALAPLPLDAWAAAGMIEVDGDVVSPRMRLRPVATEDVEWIVPCDLERRSDFVVDVSPASFTLAGVTHRPPVSRCLDLGTGSGIQALHAARHAASVVATDTNPRAVAFAEFTMRLNDTANVEVRAGSLFEPVVQERFDLIVSNPPFVISPETRFAYRDSGMVGDEICRRIVTEAPAHLNEGGWCQLLANWAHLRGTDWHERLAGWVDGLGCDAWIVQSRVEDAETYAANWLRQEPGGAGAFDEWMDHYEHIGLEAVGFGVITLHRSGRPQPWLCVEELAREFVLPCGDAIAAAFDRAAWLDDHDDAALLDARLVVSFDTTLRSSSYAAEGRWHLDQAVVELERGLHYASVVDEHGAALIAGCDGSTPVRDLVQRVADAVGIEVSDVAPSVLSMIRRSVQQGVVTPARPTAPSL